MRNLTTGNWQAYGLVIPKGPFDITKAVTYVNATHNMTPYDLPDLSDVSFNTYSFYDRKAKMNNSIEQ